MNVVAVIGNLTRDPELRQTPSGTAVCQLRIAVNERYKDGNDWAERANYFDVTVWGNQGESCAQYLAKGRRVGVDGRLRWSEWETDDGGKRQKVEIVANRVMFLTPKGESDGGGVSHDHETAADFGGSHADEDIPF